MPPGWDVPTKSDWNILFDYYDGQSRARVALTDPFLNGFKADPDGVLYQNARISYLTTTTGKAAREPRGCKGDRILLFEWFHNHPDGVPYQQFRISRTSARG